MKYQWIYFIDQGNRQDGLLELRRTSVSESSPYNIHSLCFFTLSSFVIVVRYKFWQDAENKQRRFILVELSI